RRCWRRRRSRHAPPEPITLRPRAGARTSRCRSLPRTRVERDPARWRARCYPGGRVFRMLCPHCHHENRARARFCGACGAPLGDGRTCPRCATLIPPGQKFCDACGESLAKSPSAAPAAPDPRAYTPRHLVERILTSRSALEGERKQVSVLFADLVDSMRLAEGLDPEEWHRI